MKAARQQENSAVPLPPRVKALPSTGLSAAQVRERLDAGLDNRAVESPTKTVGQIIRGNILTYFNLIFFVLALALVAVGSFKNLTFMVVVVINTLIGIVQELNAKRTLDKLTLLSEPKAAVVRDEMVMRVPVNRTVRDDIAVFAAGNQIYADAVVLDGSVQVNESLMTGEQDEITKKAGDELISGSFVVAGECRARLEKVGADSHVSRLTLEAKKDKKRKRSGMMKALTRLLQVIGVALIPVGTLMYIQQTRLLGLLPKQGVENTTAALIGMIPEGLYLLVSIALAPELANRLHNICTRKRIVRDAFFNRLFLLLAAGPKTIDRLFFPDEPKWRTAVWSEFTHAGPFFENGFYPLEAPVDPFWAIRAGLEMFNEGAGAEDFEVPGMGARHLAVCREIPFSRISGEK